MQAHYPAFRLFQCRRRDCNTIHHRRVYVLPADAYRLNAPVCDTPFLSGFLRCNPVKIHVQHLAHHLIKHIILRLVEYNMHDYLLSVNVITREPFTLSGGTLWFPPMAPSFKEDEGVSPSSLPRLHGGCSLFIICDGIAVM